MVSRQPNGISSAPRSFSGKSGGRSYCQAPAGKGPVPELQSVQSSQPRACLEPFLPHETGSHCSCRHAFPGMRGAGESWGESFWRQQLGVLPRGVCYKRPSEVKRQGPLVARIGEVAWPPGHWGKGVKPSQDLREFVAPRLYSKGALVQGEPSLRRHILS